MDLRTLERDDKVEVLMAEPGFEGSYFPAVVRARVPPFQVMVEYTTLVDDEDHNQPLREVVDVEELWPKPEPISTRLYAVGDVVDVYDRDGWWVGIVRERDPLGYLVSFPFTHEEIVFPVRLIRLHQEYDVETDSWSYRKRKVRGQVVAPAPAQAHAG